MSPQQRKPIVTVQALCKDFRRPNGNIFTVLEGINLDIYDNEIVTILGISGSGKTTLLKCMAGLLTPDRGRVNYAPQTTENKQLLSYVFQHFALFPWLTVRENIEVALQNFPRKEKATRIDDFLDLVGLKGFEDCHPRDLSGGMRQRVSLCRALVSDPMVVFMDEPFSSLDPLTAQSLRGEIDRIWMQPDRKIRSMVLVTHDPEEAIMMSDRVVILSANPGSIYKIVDVPLPRRRNPNSPAYTELKDRIETIFGELHLDRFLREGDVHILPQANGSTTAPEAPKIAQKPQKTRPLINSNLVLVEGLVSQLLTETGPKDLYDLCDDMGQSVDQMLPTVASAEMLGLLYTPGTELVLTEFGRRFASEEDNEQRNHMLREACLRLPIIAAIYNIVLNAGPDGIEKEIAVEQIAMMIPFEDPDVQFEALVKWCRYTNLIIYDRDTDLLTVGE
jgi:NitT/TauT family transport system ATP-binding protein